MASKNTSAHQPVKKGFRWFGKKTSIAKSRSKSSSSSKIPKTYKYTIKKKSNSIKHNPIYPPPELVYGDNIPPFLQNTTKKKVVNPNLAHGTINLTRTNITGKDANRKTSRTSSISNKIPSFMNYDEPVGKANNLNKNDEFYTSALFKKYQKDKKEIFENLKKTNIKNMEEIIETKSGIEKLQSKFIDKYNKSNNFLLFKKKSSISCDVYDVKWQTMEHYLKKIIDDIDRKIYYHHGKFCRVNPSTIKNPNNLQNIKFLNIVMDYFHKNVSNEYSNTNTNNDNDKNTICTILKNEHKPETTNKFKILQQELNNLKCDNSALNINTLTNNNYIRQFLYNLEFIYQGLTSVTTLITFDIHIKLMDINYKTNKELYLGGDNGIHIYDKDSMYNIIVKPFKIFNGEVFLYNLMTVYYLYPKKYSDYIYIYIKKDDVKSFSKSFYDTI